MRLENLADEKLILHTPAPSKEQAIAALCDLLYRNGNIADPAAFRAAVAAREAEFAAELTPEIAVPHAKSDTVLTPGVAAMPLQDGKAVLLIASRDNEEHIRTLARVASQLLGETEK